jgi:hypothetical protein
VLANCTRQLLVLLQLYELVGLGGSAYLLVVL